MEEKIILATFYKKNNYLFQKMSELDEICEKTNKVLDEYNKMKMILEKNEDEKIEISGKNNKNCRIITVEEIAEDENYKFVSIDYENGTKYRGIYDKERKKWIFNKKCY